MNEEYLSWLKQIFELKNKYKAELNTEEEENLHLVYLLQLFVPFCRLMDVMKSMVQPFKCQTAVMQCASV